ncbi:MAG: hypothetical protein GEU99_00680 [Luteitalea sp.]|nr:hypothetical protein [Luteitalea sp.]
MERLTSGPGPADVLPTLLLLVGSLLLVIETGSLLWSLILTRTITRSVHDLYEGTRQVAAGKLVPPHSSTRQGPVERAGQLV